MGRRKPEVRVDRECPSDAASLVLRPLAPEEFDRFLELHIPAFAAAKAASGEWPAAAALDEARQAFARALPQGLASPRHELYALVAEGSVAESSATGDSGAGGARVGWLWLELRRDALVPHAYLYELSIDEPFRRRGFGRQAIALAAARCREVGVSRLLLHVFDHNRAAIALYEQCGFTMTDHWMALAVGQDGEASAY